MAKSTASSGATKSGTAIYSCSCQHEFQDKEYGKGRRVFNLAPGKKTCTVCGKR